MARQHKDAAGTHQKSQRRSLLSLWRGDKKNGKGRSSLKEFARSLQSSETDASLVADAWLQNKGLNVSTPNKKIGRTRKGRTSKGGGQKG